MSQQEMLFPLKHNAVIGNALKQAAEHNGIYRVAMPSADTLLLPFFDDFSIPTVWPSSEHWVDSLAYIGPGFAINPPTVGVATMDGLNKEGNPYDNTSISANGLCDQLTSKPLDLFADENGLPYNASDSIFMIFYFQRKGLGDAPESNDSLRLDFYNVNTLNWDKVWMETGNSTGDTLFTKIKISIDNTDYRQKGFRFRFSNFGSKTGNLDIWNIDYVMIDKFLPPLYDVIRDFAWVYQGYSLLNSYSAVPWKHYSQLSGSQQQAMLKSSALLTLRNNNESNPFPVKVQGIAVDQYGNPQPLVGGGGLNSIQVPLNTNVSPPATVVSGFSFQDPTSGELATFDLTYVLGQTSGGVVDNFPVNDTLKFHQEFYNYYAYDDGTAELGYGINGAGGQIAYKFDVLQADTLRAVKIFFTQLGLSVTNQIFKLAVWSGSSTPSGAPIYQQFNQTPNYTDSINGFYTYLTAPTYLTPGTYFFGMVQSSSTILNLGLDMNTPADQSKKLINTTGSWINSQLPGMWMIRPVFSGTPIDVGIEENLHSEQISIYPVPAHNELNIDLDPELAASVQTRLYNSAGELVYDKMFSRTVAVNGFPSGIYLIRLTDRKSGKSVSRTIMIAD